MDTAIGGASWLIGKVLNKLSDEFVDAYVASTELGLNSEQIKTRLKHTLGLLQLAQERDVRNIPALQSLLEDLSKKADEAEDALDELHYFIIQDQLDGTKKASPDLGDGLCSYALHVLHAARRTIGNCLPFTHYDDCVTSNPHNVTNSDSGIDGGYAGKLKFDRVAMSKKIKSVIESIHNLCVPVSDLLSKIPNDNTVVAVKRTPTGSIGSQNKLYGRSLIFEKTVNMLTGGTDHGETLSVLPLVGPGGIGKTTLTQHLYNDERVKEHFTVKVWVCVSTEFDVLKLTREIHSYIPAAEKEENNIANETATLDQLQKSIAERLKAKRILIVMDDIWKCNSEGDWKNLLSPFTKGGAKGSTVLVTTRFPSIAHMVKTTNPIELRGMEPSDFLAYFEACIFGHSKPDGQYAGHLVEVRKDIASKLKGSPLAAHTVGRLLRKNLSWEYWMGVLEKSEWENITNDDDIMPCLKISYDYLPFHLKKCFSYCSLFPEDHRFYNFKMIGFWIAMGIVDSSNFQNDRNYLEELLDNGFLMKKDDASGQYYVMHDLMHELSRKVSSKECFNICNLSFRADDIPQSIRHLSITIENIYTESFVEEMGKLESRIDIGSLRSLMIFRFYDNTIENTLKDSFKDIKGLRVLFIAMKTPHSLPNGFSNLIHLQYLKISSPYGLLLLPSTLSRFYHLKFMDLQNWRGCAIVPKDINRLVNLRHFYSSKELHSNIPGVGKMKCLEELKEFHVKKENVGFDLTELGELTELGGELGICNLETVRSKGEASDAKLKNKRNLKTLRLVWAAEHQTIDDDVLEGFHPPDSLRVLGIINPGLAAGPSWLCGDISTKRLESLHLEGLSWSTLPPFEQLPNLSKVTFKNISGMRVFGPGVGGVTEKSFTRLKEIVFEEMPELVKWVGAPNSDLFSRIESIKFGDCPFLCSFPFMDCPELFTKLCRLGIENCPKLSQFPLMPHTSTLTYISVKTLGSELFYDGKELRIQRYTRALAFHNMNNVDITVIVDVSHLTWSDLQKLNCLRSIHFKRCDDMFSAKLDDTVVLHSVQVLRIEELQITGELFSKVLSCFPAVSQLTVTGCKNLELLPREDGGLGDLTRLQSFTACHCRKLFSRWPMGEVGGGAHAIKPFPTSLKELDISLESSMQSMSLLSNLTSLTSLRLIGCKELTMDGFNPLITVNLKKLLVCTMYLIQQEDISIAGDLLSEIASSKLMCPGSFQLEDFMVDSISAVLTAPICSHLAATLHTLQFRFDRRMTTFTEEQAQALQLLTSLQFLEFDTCSKLRSLPQGLRGLSSLKRLYICMCKKILTLPPKEGLPTSLENLEVLFCSLELTEQAEKLKGADPWFSVEVYVDDES